MTDRRAARQARAASWLLAPASWCAFAVGCVATVLAGPFAVFLLPLALPLLFLLFLQARYGTRLLRGDLAAARPLLGTAGLATVLLLVGAVVGLPGPTSEPPRLSDVPEDTRRGIVLLLGVASVHALAVALLWRAARRSGRASAGRRVGLALAALAVAQAAALALPLRSG